MHIPIDPLTYVEAQYVVVDSNYDADWNAEITFCGMVNVWFDDKYDCNHDGKTAWEWWFPVGNVYGRYDGFYCYSSLEDSQVESKNFNPDHTDADKLGVDNYCCRYKAQGTYTGIGGSAGSTVVTTTPFNLAEKKKEFLT